MELEELDLAHILLESDAPLIIDQPEDDLDNFFISEGIVPRMREEILEGGKEAFEIRRAKYGF